MPNIAAVLKDEITRLARKELRATTDSLRKAVTTYRSEIAALKRRIDQLEKQQRRTAKAVTRPEPIRSSDPDGHRRWRAAGFAKHRERLGISAADCGKLLGVSGLTVYKWEGGKSRPRAAHMPAIARLRSLGKREAAARLEELG